MSKTYYIIDEVDGNTDFRDQILEVSRYDFLPVVKINSQEEGKDAKFSLNDSEKQKKEIITLSEDFDADLRSYKVPDIDIVRKSKSYVPIKILSGSDGAGFEDGDGVLIFQCANCDVQIKLLDKPEANACTDRTEEYDPE